MRPLGGWASWRLSALMVFTDLVAVLVAFGAAIFVADFFRVLLGMQSQPVELFIDARGRELALLTGLTVVVFAFGGLYRRTAWELSEVKHIAAAIGLVALFDAALQYIIRTHDSRLWFVAAYPLAAFTVMSFRMMVRSHPRLMEAMTYHVILIGEAVTPDLLINELRESRSGPVKLLKRHSFDDLCGNSPEALSAVLSETARLSGLPERKILTVLAPTIDELPKAQTLIEKLNAARRPYSIVLPFRGLARHGLNLQEVIGADMILAEMTPVGDRPVMRIVKRAIDSVAALLALILLSPVILVAALLLLLEGGPVLFTQTRVGRNDSRFTCYKFRSMRPDAEARLEALLAADPAAREEWNSFQKLTDDPRVTPLGRFLRRASIDELPQLWNVLRGDMSLVGPRPIIAPEVEGYPSDRAYYHSPEFIYYRRSTPGVTGLWQVSGRSETTHEERVRLDRWYYRNWSLWLDLVVIFKTIGAVLGRRGSH